MQLFTRNSVNFIVQLHFMNTLIHRISSILMALFVLISTSGFMIYERQCECSNTISTALFIDHYKDCCQHEAPSCCDEQQHSCNHGDADSDQDCCESSPRYFRINIPVNLPVQAQSVTESFKLVQTHSVLQAENLTEENGQVIEITESPPPILQGTRLILYLHQLKIAPPLS